MAIVGPLVFAGAYVGARLPHDISGVERFFTGVIGSMGTLAGLSVIIGFVRAIRESSKLFRR